MLCRGGIRRLAGASLLLPIPLNVIPLFVLLASVYAYVYSLANGMIWFHSWLSSLLFNYVYLSVFINWRLFRKLGRRQTKVGGTGMTAS
jgi:hypothetical protein